MATRTRLTAIAAATLTAGLLLTGCGADTKAAPRAPQVTDAPTGASEPSAPYTVNPAKDPVHPTNIPKPNKNQKIPTLCNEQTKPFTGPVADEWGADQVMDAYCELIDFNSQNQITGLIEKTWAEQEPRDYAFLEKYMTPEAADRFRREVSQGLADVKANPENMDGMARLSPLTLTSVEFLDPYTFKKDGPYSVGFEASEALVRSDQAKTTVGVTPALTFTFTMSTSIYLQDEAGEPFSQKMTKDLTFRVIPTKSDDRDWLVDGWMAEIIKYDPVKPYTAKPGKSSEATQ